MKLQLKIALFILIHLMGKLCYSQYLVSSTFVNTMSQISLNSLTGLALQYDVDMYKMIYNTTDAHSQPTIASGALLIPTNTVCKEFPISVYAHGTSLRKIDVPSNDVSETVIGKVFSAGGYFTCMPDYIGMGDSPGLHPYVHAESEATASIDMIRAAREFIQDSLEMVDNILEGKEYLVGNQLTEADIRLIPTLLRFDSVYHVHFKCNLKKISEFKNISNYVKKLFNIPAINSTTDFDHIKRHYYFSHESINPNRIIPLGPEIPF